MKTYAGVGGVAKLAQRMYAGINGVAANALKAYIGDENGKAKLWFSSMPSVVWKKSNVYENSYSGGLEIYGICYDNGNACSCGRDLRYLREDGKWILSKYSNNDYTSATYMLYGPFQDVCAHDGLIVAVCTYTTSNPDAHHFGGIYYSTDGGVTFTQCLEDNSGKIYSAKYLNGRWIALTDSTYFYHSADGISWTKVAGLRNSGGNSRSPLDAFYDDAKAMWIVNCSDCYYKSSNGTSWSRADGKYGYRFKNGTNVIVIYDGWNKISYSTDSGATLTESVFENDAKYSDPSMYYPFHNSDTRGVCFADGKWVLGSASGLIYSEDFGATFKKCKAPKIEICEVRNSDGVWMATGKESYILYSLDGITWFNAVTLKNRYMYGLVCVDGRWITGGQNGLIYCDAFIEQATS